MSSVALRYLATSAALAALCVTTVVQAQTVRVRCESTPDRSKASVDGNNLAPGKYRALLESGNHRKKSPRQKAVGDEAEFDFDSNTEDDATHIGENFIVNNMVTGSILDAEGNLVVKDTVQCD